MKDYTKKFKQEWAFFIHPKTGRVTYNPICVCCRHDCKQSFRAKIIACQTHEKEGNR